MSDVDREDSIPQYSPFSYTSESNLQTLQSGLPKATRPKTIAVIGAGIAGLTAGWLLERQGHTVTIFEAKHTVGGRVKTLRDGFTSGFYAEAGAMRIPCHHKLAGYLVDKFGLRSKCHEFPMENKDGHGLIYVNGERRNFIQYKRNKELLPGFVLADGERGRTAEELFEDVTLEYIGSKHKQRFSALGFIPKKFADLRSASVPQDLIYAILKDLDNCSLHDFLRVRAVLSGTGRTLSEAAIDLISTMMMWEMQMSSSMASVVSLEIELSAEEFYHIEGGMDNLPKGFLGEEEYQNTPSDTDFPNLKDNIVYNSRVIDIYNLPPKLAVAYENTVTGYVKNPDLFDIVVIALPFSVARHIRMPGLVSPEKRQAIRQLTYSNSCKILLEFRHRFWEDDIPGQLPIKGGGRSVTDLPIRLIYYPGEAQSRSARGGLVLASYTWGDESSRWTSLSRSNRIRLALRDLEYVHRRNEGRLLMSCVGGVSHSWAEDEFTGGAFAQFEPWQRIKLFDYAWRPEGSVYYCGEHTSTKHGWIEGAIESGIRVAHEIADERGLIWRVKSPSV